MTNLNIWTIYLKLALVFYRDIVFKASSGVAPFYAEKETLFVLVKGCLIVNSKGFLNEGSHLSLLLHLEIKFWTLIPKAKNPMGIVIGASRKYHLIDAKIT